MARKIYESEKKANAKSRKKLYIQYNLILHHEYEADVLEWLDQQENKRQYIISLIRADISKKQGKD